MTRPGVSPPEVIATVGLHGSASTWVFNVIREVVAATIGADRMLTSYGDDVGHLPAESERAGKCLVLKSHHGSHGLDAWLRERDAAVVLSLRDPRDACVSMSERFAAPLRQSVGWIARDCRRVARLAEQGHPRLRFEDRFFEDRGSVDRLSDWLGVTCAPEVKDSISSATVWRPFGPSRESLRNCRPSD